MFFLFVFTFFYADEIQQTTTPVFFPAILKQGNSYHPILHAPKPLGKRSSLEWFTQQVAINDKALNASVLKSEHKTCQEKNRITHYTYRRYKTEKGKWRIVFYSTSLFSDQIGQIKTLQLASADLADDRDLLRDYMQYGFYTGLLSQTVYVDLNDAVAEVKSKLRVNRTPSRNKIKQIKQIKRHYAAPVPIKYARITSGFGYRTDPFNKHKRMHGGIDFAAARGTKVLSIDDGIVSFVGRRGGYGKVVEVNHGDGLISRYAHLKRARSRLHQKVLKGAIIAEVGTTGRSTGAHLHLELLVNGQRKNPVHYLSSTLSTMLRKKRNRNRKRKSAHLEVSYR